MARASAAAENAAVNGITAVGLYLSLHSADPGTTGASEITGGGYARQAITWGAASGGTATNTGALSFTVAAATTVAYVGVWSAATTGTYYVGAATTSVTFNQAGTASVAASALTLAAA